VAPGPTDLDLLLATASLYNRIIEKDKFLMWIK
jgi:hypothetical protein